MDAAEPSTNGVSASNLYRLGALLSDGSYTSLARRTVDAFATEMGQHPFLFGTMLSSVVAGRLGMSSVVITGEGEEVDAAVAKSRLRLKGNTTVARKGGGARSEWLEGRNGLIGAMDPGRAGMQLCEGGVCREVLGVEDVGKVLG